MDKTITRPSSKTDAEYLTELNQLFAEFDRVQERIEKREQAAKDRQHAIEIMQRETRQKLDELGAKL
jgi:hypothetical protein